VPIGLIDLVPPSGIQVGPLFVGFYGLGYVVAITVMVLVSQAEARRRGIDPGHVLGAALPVAVFALIGARLYHVIDEWPRYAADPLAVVLPPYSGLGVFGGILGAVFGIWLYVRGRGIPFSRALDVVVPGTLFAQGIARWGNFFNQELYGPPTDLPFAIAIDCAHRVAPWYCPGDPRLAGAAGVPEGVGFHPLFFYESALVIAGGVIALLLSRRVPWLRAGDLASFWLVWYGAVRLVLESFRMGYNWTIAGIPTAMLVGAALIAIGLATAVRRHRRGPDAPGRGEPGPAWRGSQGP
jgi:phosphatidylglycerol---prolipoprotein diacylglyceryl transferase